MNRKKWVFPLVDFSYYMLILNLILDLRLGVTAIRGYDDSFFHHYLQIMTLFFALLNIFARKYSKKYLLAIILGVFPGAITYITTNSSLMFFSMLAIFLIGDTDVESVLKEVFLIYVFVFLFANVAAFVGVIPNGMSYVLEGTKKCYFFGYNNPNSYASALGIIVLLYWTIKRNKLTKNKVIGGMIIQIINYLITSSRTSIFISVVVVLFFMFLKNSYFRKILRNWSVWIFTDFVLLNGLSILMYMMIGRGNILVDIINDGIFNGRIGLAWKALYEYKLSLFGEQIDISYVASRTNYFALDNGFVIILLYYGIIGFATVFIIYYLLMKHLRDKEEYILIIVGIAFIIWTMYEGTMATLESNFVYLFLGKYLSELSIHKKNIEEKT